MNYIIRDIEPGDNVSLARIIRNSLEEFRANKKGTVYYDDSTDHLSDLFKTAGSRYFVATSGKNILGGAGIFPTHGLPEGVSELVKMYLLPEARGHGIGSALINKCIEFAKSIGNRSIYIETLPELSTAVKVYEHLGFNYLDKPMGDSKHSGCSLWMVKHI
jgi:putative acetyltransferase